MLNSQSINREIVGCNMVFASTEKFNLTSTFRLPHFDMGLGKAYVLDNETGSYIIVFSSPDFVRIHDMIKLREVNTHGLEIPEKFGILHLEEKDSFYMIMSKPSSVNMYERIVLNYFDNQLISSWLLEIFEILHTMHSNGIMHGCLNGNTIRVSKDDHITISNCFANACGVEQLDIFETINRARCHKYGKYNQSFASDYYAVGVLLLEIISGKQITLIPKLDIIQKKLMYGSFSYLCKQVNLNLQNIEPSYKNLLYLASKLLSDDEEKRWNWFTSIEFLNSIQNREEIDKELEEKFFYNIELSSNIYESKNQHSITFNHIEYQDLRTLVIAMEDSWNDSIDLLKSGKIMKWLLQSKQFEGAIISSFNRIYIESRNILSQSRTNFISREDAFLSYFIMNEIMKIDETTKIMSFRGITFHIDSIGLLLQYFYVNNQIDSINDIQAFIKSNLLSNIFSFFNLNTDYIKNIIQIIQNNQNIKHILYCFNSKIPHLFLNKYICFSPQDFISVLEQDTNIESIEHIPIMKDSLFFLISRLNIENIPNSILYPGLEKLSEERLFSLLQLLAIAQEKKKAMHVTKLFANAIKTMVLPLLYSKKAQKQLISSIDLAEKSGLLIKLLKILCHKSIKNDYSRYKTTLVNLQKILKEKSRLSIILEDERINKNFGHSITIKFAVLIWICTVFILSI